MINPLSISLQRWVPVQGKTSWYAIFLEAFASVRLSSCGGGVDVRVCSAFGCSLLLLCSCSVWAFCLLSFFLLCLFGIIVLGGVCFLWCVCPGVFSELRGSFLASY